MLLLPKMFTFKIITKTVIYEKPNICMQSISLKMKMFNNCFFGVRVKNDPWDNFHPCIPK